MNAWEMLGVAPGADRAAIKAAYFEKIKIHSPDKNPERFKQIRAAYEELVGRTGGRSTDTTVGLRRLTFRPETFPTPHTILDKQKKSEEDLTIQQLIRLTL